MTELVGVAILVDAVRAGVHVVWNPPGFRGLAAALARAKGSPATAREVLRRATAFRTQLGAVGQLRKRRRPGADVARRARPIDRALRLLRDGDP